MLEPKTSTDWRIDEGNGTVLLRDEERPIIALVDDSASSIIAWSSSERVSEAASNSASRLGIVLFSPYVAPEEEDDEEAAHEGPYRCASSPSSSLSSTAASSSPSMENSVPLAGGSCRSGLSANRTDLEPDALADADASERSIGGAV